MTGASDRVLILGGGMAGLSTAWALSRPGWRERFESITVVQRGWRLGGKGASGRGVHGRNEEHGLHIWLGYYDNAFRLVRQAYDELDRPTRDPSVPLRTWRDAFVPAGRVGLAAQGADDAWRPWIAELRADALVPGDDEVGAEPLSVEQFVRRGLTLLSDFATSLAAEPVPTAPSGALTDGRSPLEQIAELAAAELLRRFGGRRAARQLHSITSSGLAADPRWRRSFQLADLVATSVLGVWRDRLLDDPRGFAAANDEDYRAWMRRHGAAEGTLASPLVNGVYDLVFGYRGGDRDAPAFSAGVGLVLSAKMFFEYRGAVFWKMTAGMGDAVVAPLYQALAARGVEFRFFTDVKALHVSPDRRSIDGVTVGVQAELVDPAGRYDPLVRVRQLPCWPSSPRGAQLRADGRLDRTTLESYEGGREVRRELLRRGDDFDELVFALPAGVIGLVGGELLATSRRWRNVDRHIGTVATQSAQVWLSVPAASLGSRLQAATVAGFGHPLDTYADMSQLLPSEEWPDGARPQGLGYFCSTLADGAGTSATDAVRSELEQRLRSTIGHLWPGAVTTTGEFRWDVLHAPDDVGGPDRLDHQYWQANVDPAERYVQSLPGTDRYRLAADESGFDHLTIAGDWTHNGLNAGCIEAAVRSGLQAANAVLGRPLDEGVAGFYAA